MVAAVEKKVNLFVGVTIELIAGEVGGVNFFIGQTKKFVAKKVAEEGPVGFSRIFDSADDVKAAAPRWFASCGFSSEDVEVVMGLLIKDLENAAEAIGERLLEDLTSHDL